MDGQSLAPSLAKLLQQATTNYGPAPSPWAPMRQVAPPQAEPWMSRSPMPSGWEADIPSLQVNELGGAPKDVMRGLMPVGIGARKYIPF